MHTYDILMVIVLIGATLIGSLKGFAWQLASIASIAISYTVAYQYREPFSQNIHAEPPWDRFLAMLLLFVGTTLVIWVALRMIAETIDRMKLKEFDRQVGALFGLGKGAIYCTLLTFFALTLFGEQSQHVIMESRSGRWIVGLLDQSDAITPEELAAVVRPCLQRLEAQTHSLAGADSQLDEASPIDTAARHRAWQRQPTPTWSAGSTEPPGNTPKRSPRLQPEPRWRQATKGQAQTGY